MATHEIQHFFDPKTSTLTYVVYDPESKTALLIDPVADYDANRVRVTHDAATEVARFIDRHGLDLQWVLETHVHADHLTAMPFFVERYGARTAISAHVTKVQETFAKVFGLKHFPADGSQFDLLLEDGVSLEVGPLVIEALPTHGHTPASLTYRIGDTLFVGDSLFQPDYGTARCDFPGGSAQEQYRAIQRLYELPEATRVFTGHDYQPGGRALEFESTIGEQRTSNVHLRHDTTEAEYVALRRELEDGKALPTLLFPALQVNIRAGHLPPPAANGTAYLVLPLNQF